MGVSDSAADPTRDFQQLSLLFTDPIQHDYEVIRPIMLEAETVTARSHQTGVERTVVGAKARRFVQHGMLGLVDQRPRPGGPQIHPFSPTPWPATSSISSTSTRPFTTGNSPASSSGSSATILITIPFVIFFDHHPIPRATGPCKWTPVPWNFKDPYPGRVGNRGGPLHL